MSKDTRIWAKIDLGYLDNPKMSDVLDASSNAVCMHLASILHCAQHLTDGHASPKAMQRKVGGTDKDTQILVEMGLWHEPGHDCKSCPQPSPGRVFVHDYPRHNVSSGDSERRSERARKAAKARWDKPQTPDASSNASSNASSMPNAMLDREIDREIEDTLSSHVASDDDGKSNEVEVEQFFSEEVTELCEHLASLIRSNGNKVGKVGVTWWKAMDRLIRIDDYTPDQVRQVIDWSQQDEFWQGNIRSAPKLREKFDQLKTRMFSERQKQSQPPAYMTATERKLAVGAERAQRLKQQAEQPVQYRNSILNIIQGEITQ